MPYHPYLCTQFSIAFDVYLEIIHRIEQHIQAVFKNDTQEWQLQNECPACFYHLELEPPLTFDWLISINGNNSLKWWDSAVYSTIPHDDSWLARLTYWLSEEDVNKFKDEVKSRKVYFPFIYAFLTDLCWSLR